MWKNVEGKRKSAYFDVIDDDKWLEREDGANLWRFGIGRESQEYFQFQKGDLKFNFYAERWDQKANKPTDVYIVLVRLSKKGWPLSIEDTAQAIISHAKEIESGLLAYPLHRDWEGVPVREILFDISPIGSGRKLVCAEEVK